jgi:predicted ATPase/DNA-binding winged helix-turn-helix (wHTH) protein
VADLAPSSAEGAISFGPFRLFPTQRLLFEGDKPVRLGSRAFDMLIALVEHPGEVVGRDELMARVWPNTHVDEGNLKFQISALRRTLGGGNRYLVNIPGRGYSFVAPVTPLDEAETAAPEPPEAVTGHNLPALLTRLVGRDETVSRLVGRFPRQRLLTIVGPGGIGKTSLALAVAEQFISTYEHGVWLIDLAPLSDPGLVPSALADTLGLQIRSEDSLPGLVASLRDKKMLLVLDNCEHVIEAAAALAVTVLTAAPGVQVLATSREPLRIEGEHVHRLSPLASPPTSAPLTAAEALGYSAVQLFVERTAATLDEFELTDTDAPIVADICGRLDGIALAIELAATRIDTFGVRGVAAHLDDRFQLLTRGRRTALPRHRTLRATLDWSYQLLPEPERVVLRRLAIFAGGFTEEAASAVAAGAEIAASGVVEALANLVTKSLVSVDVGGVIARYRLPETIRAYALEKLAESGEREQIARRHAEYHLSLFERAEAEAETRPMAAWLAEYLPRIDNLRIALDWAFSPGGDTPIGVALTAASVPLWVDLSLMAECRRHIERALARLDAVADLDPRQEMHLQAALGVSLNYTTGPVPETAAAWMRTLEIAKSLGDVEYQLRALRGLWAHWMNAGEYRASLAIADEFSALAATTGDPAALGAADRMAGIILHYLGDQTGAREHLERRLARAVSPVRQSPPVRFLIDQRVAARALLARILWLQGFPDQAASTARLAVDEAEASGHALSLCHALAQAACSVATLNGDVEAAERFTAVLLDRARELGLAGWIARGHCFQGVVLIMRRDFAAGLPLLRDALDELREGGAAPGYPAFLAVLARGLGLAGQVTEGLAVIDQALALSQRHEENWSLPEVLRNKGELLLLERSAEAAVAAEDYFRQALDWAHRDGTLSYELRAAFSLGRLWRDQGRRAEARELVASVYRGFTEGFETADLQTARRLLDELSNAAKLEGAKSG